MFKYIWYVIFDDVNMQIIHLVFYYRKNKTIEYVLALIA